MRHWTIDLGVVLLWLSGVLLLIFAVIIHPPIKFWPEIGFWTPVVASLASMLAGFSTIIVAYKIDS